ncbi:type II 3-dehydroquinate dehydratase [Cystobasidium minutum MCA 4210]|uniref:type II 3-dehydroquinate dehydratase n=1 Tax=Cystobasidium minutum MCA 4210 TaxID=1397322 RepID=UPI0034CD83B7|eukprot:jgi/Rhomi1/192133/gm1.347_g
MSFSTTEAGVTRIRNADPDDGKLLPKERDTFLLLSGPNHNLFGERDPKTYGSTTLAQIEQRVTELGKELGVKVYGGIIMNPGAFCHDSYSVRDAISGIDTPVFEIHISNIEAREEFRKSKTAAVCKAGCLFGAGVYGYELALRGAVAYAKANPVA